MSTSVEAAQRIEQCENLLGPSSPLRGEACFQEIVYAVAAFMDHRTINHALVKKLQLAAEECCEQTNPRNAICNMRSALIP